MAMWHPSFKYYKENFVTLHSTWIIVIKVVEKEKQGQSSTLADILVDNLTPNSIY